MGRMDQLKKEVDTQLGPITEIFQIHNCFTRHYKIPFNKRTTQPQNIAVIQALILQSGYGSMFEFPRRSCFEKYRSPAERLKKQKKLF
jgi:hypothetical protein